MLFKLWIILNQIAIWLLVRKSDDEYVEPHYFNSDFGLVCSIHRTHPRTVWQIITNKGEVYCSGEQLFFDRELRPIPAHDLDAGVSLSTARGTDVVISARCLNVRAHMYTLDVIATPKMFFETATANGFISRIEAIGSTQVTVRHESVPVHDLVQRGPLDRLVEWLCSYHVRLAARHLQQVVKVAH